MAKASTVSAITSAKNDKTFTSLHVEKRILRTASVAVQIPNISSVGLHEKSANALYVIILLICILGSFFYGANVPRQNFGDSPSTYYILSGLLLVVLILYLKGTHRFFMFVALNSGERLIFETENRKFASEVFEFLQAKINDQALDMQANIDFSKNVFTQGSTTITTDTLRAENLSVDQLKSDVSISGDNNTYAPNTSGAVFGAQATGNNASIQGAELNSSASITFANTKIEFGDLTGKIEQISEHLQKTSGQNQELSKVAVEVQELITLMKNGAPTAEAKSRVRQICEDASLALQSVPVAVTLFQKISDLVV